ncbi:MAG: hypothetical protein Q9M43_00185 [Sulfurimonas sp.]|nr:hypothetical protein [Sulfurimonas sp.]
MPGTLETNLILILKTDKPFKINSVLNDKYAKYFNKKYTRSGHLWQGRYNYYHLLTNSMIFDMTLMEYTEYVSSDFNLDAIDIVYDSPKLIIVDGKYKVLKKRIETFFEQDRDINRNSYKGIRQPFIPSLH